MLNIEAEEISRSAVVIKALATLFKKY